MIDRGHARLSIVRQCELASISRSSSDCEPGHGVGGRVHRQGRWYTAQYVREIAP
jgi:hypothetical protein